MRAWLAAALVACTAWCAGNVALVFVAQKVFAIAPPRGEVYSRAEAGALFGSMLQSWTQASFFLLLILAVALVVVIILLARLRKLALASLTCAALAACVALYWSGTSLMVRAQQKSEAARQKGLDPNSEPGFAALHRRSTQVFGMQTVLLAIIGISLLVALSSSPNGALQSKSPGQRPG
jgi:hypothetical protein